jgi:hypothetical protein
MLSALIIWFTVSIVASLLVGPLIAAGHRAAPARGSSWHDVRRMKRRVA